MVVESHQQDEEVEISEKEPLNDADSIILEMEKAHDQEI